MAERDNLVYVERTNSPWPLKNTAVEPDDPSRPRLFGTYHKKQLPAPVPFQIVKTNTKSKRRTIAPQSVHSRKRKFPGPAGNLPPMGQSIVQEHNKEPFENKVFYKALVTMHPKAREIVEMNDIASIRYKGKHLVTIPYTPLMCFVIEKIDNDLRGILFIARDPSGSMRGQVDEKLIKEHKDTLRVGTVVLMQKVANFSYYVPHGRRSYLLMLHQQNVLALYNATKTGVRVTVTPCLRESQPFLRPHHPPLPDPCFSTIASPTSPPPSPTSTDCSPLQCGQILRTPSSDSDTCPSLLPSRYGTFLYCCLLSPNAFKHPHASNPIQTNCGNQWTSMKGRIISFFALVPEKCMGVVMVRLYGQKCKRCSNPNFLPAMWYADEVLKVLRNVFHRVGQRYYGFVQPPLRMDRRHGKSRDEHNKQLCQACTDGLCRESQIFT